MSTLEAVLAQYEKNKQATSGTVGMSQEDRMKKYFTTVLPKGIRSQEKRIRILPAKDGSPFVEVFFHEIQVNGDWVKLYDPKQEGKRSPLDEVREGLMTSGVESDKVLARQYRSRKFFIVKLIDRDNEQDGVKFWRFKYNTKSEGVYDKLIPLFRNKGDITDPLKGRDLILNLNLSKAGNGRDYTTITQIIPEDPSPLHEDKSVADSWINDPLIWSDVYSKKPEEYLEMVATDQNPKWDSVTGKWVSTSSGEEKIGGSNKTEQPQTQEPDYVDPQEGFTEDDELPF
jgi:hypothetical protein